MPFPTYTSDVPRTITTVEHLDGIPAVYRLGLTGETYYTPVSQEEAWIFEESYLDWGLRLASVYGQGAYGAGPYG